MALDTQVERAPETVLNNLAQDALQPLVRQGALDAADLTLARQRARRAVKRRAALEGAGKRKAFADFRANLEIAARRGEVGQKFIDRQHELGAITLSERNRYVRIAKRVRERREEAAAQRRELEALEAGGGTVGAAVSRGIRTNLDGLIAAGARDPELVRFALEAGAITKEGARERLERMRAGEAKIAEREALVERGRRADKEPLDPTNPQDRKAAELHYRRDVGPRIERLSSDPKTAKRAVREGAAFVEKTGVVPKAYAGQITRALASENPGIQAVGALHLHETLRRNPAAVPIVVGDKDTVFAVHAATLQEAGFDGPGAVKQATAAKEATPQQRDTHLEAYDLERERHERDNLAFLTENGLTEAQASKFDENVRRIYGTTGNLPAARQGALALAKRGAGQPVDAEGKPSSVSEGKRSSTISGASGDDTLLDGEPGIGDGDKRTRIETYSAFRRFILDGELPEQVSTPNRAQSRYRFGRRVYDATTLGFLKRAANATPKNVEKTIREIFDSPDLPRKQKGRLATIARAMAAEAKVGESESSRFNRLAGLLTEDRLVVLSAGVASIERSTETTFRVGGTIAKQILPILSEIEAGKAVLDTHRRWTEALERGDVAAAREHAKELHEQLIGLIPIAGRFGRGASKILPKNNKPASEALKDARGKATGTAAKLKQRIQDQANKLNDWLQSTKPQPVFAIPGGSGRGGRLPRTSFGNRGDRQGKPVQARNRAPHGTKTKSRKKPQLSKFEKQVLTRNKKHNVIGRKPPTGGRDVPDNLKWLNSNSPVRDPKTGKIIEGPTGVLKGHAKKHPLNGNTDPENYRRQSVRTVKFGNHVERTHNGQVKDYYIRHFRTEIVKRKKVKIFLVVSMPRKGPVKAFTAREYTPERMRKEFGWTPAEK